DRSPEHRLHALARHRALCAALRLLHPHAEHPASGRPGDPLPQGLLRRPDVLGQPGLSTDRSVRTHERNARPRPPWVVAQRLHAPRRPHAARPRLSLGADRRAAHLEEARRDRLRRGGEDRHQPRAPDRPRRRRVPEPPGRGAVLPLGRLLRDSPRVSRSQVGPRHPLRAAAAQPPRRARDPPRHGRLPGQRTRARPGCGRGPRLARGLWALGADADRLHHRSRHPLSGRQGDPLRPRPRGDADHARSGRLHGRPRPRRPGLAHRRLSDAVRARGRRAPRLPPGHVADAARAPRGRRGQRGDLRRIDLARRLRASACGADEALEVHPPLRRPRAARAAQHRRRSEQGLPAAPRLGRADRPVRAALRPRVRSGRVVQPGRAGAGGFGARGDARPARTVDGRDRGPSAARSGRAAVGSRGQRSGRAVVGRGDDLGAL
ncbi:MAG: Sulfatase, partial [uncultured Solirubrobacterales bacterium]